MTALYIIGNGFDIHHGIDSKYSAFGKFLFVNDRETYNFVEKYFAVEDDFWSDFEARLADFDAGSLIENASDFSFHTAQMIGTIQIITITNLRSTKQSKPCR